MLSTDLDFLKFKNELDVPDDDYWYDVGCDIARDILDRNRDVLFPKLIDEWELWPVVMQEHLAYILGEGKSTSELELIKEMLKAKNANVAYRAREALVNFESKT